MLVSAGLQSLELDALEAARRPIRCLSCHTRYAPRTVSARSGVLVLRMRQSERAKCNGRMREHLGHKVDAMGSACLTCLRQVSPLFLPPSATALSAACLS